jgi:hypothetical protein
MGTGKLGSICFTRLQSIIQILDNNCFCMLVFYWFELYPCFKIGNACPCLQDIIQILNNTPVCYEVMFMFSCLCLQVLFKI